MRKLPGESARRGQHEDADMLTGFKTDRSCAAVAAGSPWAHQEAVRRSRRYGGVGALRLRLPSAAAGFSDSAPLCGSLFIKGFELAE